MTTKNKYATRVSTPYADDTTFNQTHFPTVDGHTLGDYSPDDSIMQRELEYNNNEPNVQSAIEHLNYQSKIPIGGVLTYADTVLANLNTVSQIDTTIITAPGEVTSTTTKLILYGILFDVPAGTNFTTLTNSIRTRLLSKALFKDLNVTYISPNITITATHYTGLPRIPCFIEDGGSNTGIFGELSCVSTSTPGNWDGVPGYGVWRYLGWETKSLQISAAGDSTPKFYHFVRES